MSTTLIRAYESFFTLIDVEGTTEGRALAVSSNKSYAQVFFAKENSSEPRFFFMADIPDTNNLIVQIYTVNVSGSGSSTSYTPNTQLASFSGEFNYLNTPDNEEQPFSEALWYYIDTEVNLVQGNYYAIVFSSSETVQSSSPKIYYSKTYRSEIFPIFLGKTTTEDWSNELVPVSSSGSVRSGSFVSGFTGKEVNSISDFDSGTVSIGGTGASARRGYATYLYVQKESSITNDVAVQFFQEPPSSSLNGTSEETDQAMMRFYYFKKGTLPLSGKAFYNKTINSSPTLDDNANFILFTQPDRLPPVPKSYLPDAYMDVDSNKVGIVSIYESFENSKHEIERQRGIIEDVTDRSALEYWAHFAEMRHIGLDDNNNRDPKESCNPAYLDFSLEQKGNEIQSLGNVILSETESPYVRGYTNITRIGNWYIGFPKYQTYSYDWWENAPAYEGSTPKMTLRGIIASINTPDSWSFIDIEITSDYDPYDAGVTDERGVYPNDSVLGNPNGNYSNRYIGVHDTFALSSNKLFGLMQVFPQHVNAPSGEADVLKPARPFCNLIVSFTDFNTTVAPSTISFKAVKIENSDPYDGRFEARSINTSSLGLIGENYGIDFDLTGNVVENANYDRLYPNIDADYQAAKFISSTVGDSDYVYFTISNNRHESKIENVYGDRRYGPVDAVSKFGFWKVSKNIQNVDFYNNSIQSEQVPTSPFQRNLYSRHPDFLGNWETGISYSFGDLVAHEGNLYIEKTGGHVSSVFEADYLSGAWAWLGNLGNINNRGFDVNIEHEYEISYTLNSGGNLYIGTTTALTQTSPPNVTETFFDWHEGRRYQKGDYVSNPSDNLVYLCSTDHNSSTLIQTDIDDGFWIAESDFRPNMCEVYKTDDLENFDEVIDGKTNQDWLSGFVERAIDLTSYGGADEPFRNNDRVAFIDLVENILHVWTTSSAKYDQGIDVRTPFHIAHDTIFGRTKVLRKFPVTGFYEEADYYDLSNNGGNEVAAGAFPASPANRFSYEKGTIFNDGGTYYVLNRKIVYDAANDKEINNDITWSFNGIKSAGLLSQTFLPTSKQNNFFNRSMKITQFIEGKRVGDFIYLCGIDDENISGITDTYPEFKHGVRWIQYDRRTINDAFNYYDDSSYKIDENANDYITVATNPVSYWAGNGESSLVVAPYDLMEFLGSKWGVYHHKTLAKYDFFETSSLIRDYPALNISESNPRIGKYCSMVIGVTDFTPTSSGGLLPSGTVESDLYNRNPRLFTQGGICYLVTENIDRGAQVYKTYGFKQNPNDWGMSRRFEGTYYGNDNTLQPSRGESNIAINDIGDRRGINTYNFDLDKPSFERSLPGFSTMEEYNSYKLFISETPGQNFLTEIKEDRSSFIGSAYGYGYVGSLDYFESLGSEFFNVNAVDSDIAERHVFRATVATSLPQNISFLYNLRETSFIPFEDTEDTIDLPSFLPIADNTNMTLRYAETLEELFNNPEKIEIPLAQERIVDVGLFDKIMLYNRALATDIQPNFFRLESSKLIQNNDGTNLSYSYVTYDENTGVKTVDDPFAEIIIKGLRFHDVDLSGAIEKSPLPDKLLAINGITHRSSQIGDSTATRPEDIISTNTNTGAIFSSDNFVTLFFPKPIYISSISFNAYYDGVDSSAGDLSTFNISAIPLLEKQLFNRNLYSDQDWVSLGNLNFDFTSGENLALNGVSLYTKAIRIKLTSGVNLRVNNLKFKTFIETSGTTFTTSGNVYNPELILVDDLRGIITGTTDSTNSTAYATFRGAGSSLTFNLGEEIPINRISTNIINAENTRTIRVEVADATDTFETIFTGNILNYEYALVQWKPRAKESSRVVDIRVLDTETQNDLSGGFSQELIDFILNNSSSNFSTNFDENILTKYSFRPNAFGERTLTIFGSSNETIQDNYDGSISVNTQMDEDGYFSDDISMGLGMIERPLNIDFPLKNVKKIRITVLNYGSNLIRMNGLKVYTPLIDSNGDHVTPQSQVTWNIRLSSVVV